MIHELQIDFTRHNNGKLVPSVFRSQYEKTEGVPFGMFRAQKSVEKEKHQKLLNGEIKSVPWMLSIGDSSPKKKPFGIDWGDKVVYKWMEYSSEALSDEHIQSVINNILND